MEFFGVCILLSTVVVCLTAYALGLMVKESFDTWIRTTDGWCTREPLPVEKN
jgi:hypothetical protein